MEKQIGFGNDPHDLVIFPGLTHLNSCNLLAINKNIFNRVDYKLISCVKTAPFRGKIVVKFRCVGPDDFFFHR